MAEDGGGLLVLSPQSSGEESPQSSVLRREESSVLSQSSLGLPLVFEFVSVYVVRMREYTPTGKQWTSSDEHSAAWYVDDVLRACGYTKKDWPVIEDMTYDIVTYADQVMGVFIPYGDVLTMVRVWWRGMWPRAEEWA